MRRTYIPLLLKSSMPRTGLTDGNVRGKNSDEEGTHNRTMEMCLCMCRLVGTHGHRRRRQLLKKMRRCQNDDMVLQGGHYEALQLSSCRRLDTSRSLSRRIESAGNGTDIFLCSFARYRGDFMLIGPLRIAQKRRRACHSFIAFSQG